MNYLAVVEYQVNNFYVDIKIPYFNDLESAGLFSQRCRRLFLMISESKSSMFLEILGIHPVQNIFALDPSQIVFQGEMNPTVAELSRAFQLPKSFNPLSQHSRRQETGELIKLDPYVSFLLPPRVLTNI